MGCEIVHDHDIALFEGRRELSFDIGLEDAPIHRSVDDEGGGEPIAAQTGDECLRLPVPERRLGAKPLALRAAAAQAGHLGRGSGLVQEDQPVRLKPHSRLARGCPFFARLFDVGPILFARQQGFF